MKIVASATIEQQWQGPESRHGMIGDLPGSRGRERKGERRPGAPTQVVRVTPKELEPAPVVVDDLEPHPFADTPAEVQGPKPPGRRFVKDRSTRGRPFKTVCICIPVDDLEVIDAECARRRVARSELLRAAALELAGRKP